MATISLFWDTNMAAVTSCENTLYLALDYHIGLMACQKITWAFGNFHLSNKLFLSKNIQDFSPGVGIGVYRQSA